MCYEIVEKSEENDFRNIENALPLEQESNVDQLASKLKPRGGALLVLHTFCWDLTKSLPIAND